MTTILILLLQVYILYLLLVNPNKHSEKPSDKKKVRTEDSKNIVGKSSFVLTKKKEGTAPVDSFGKMDIEVPLEYEEDISPIEGQEELERYGIPLEYALDISFEDMIEVVNDVDGEQPKNPEKTGKLLYENDNTDWVRQMESTAPVFQKRIAGLIDLHLGKSIRQQPAANANNKLNNFDINKYVQYV